MHKHKNRKPATPAFLAAAKARDVLQRTYGNTTALGNGAVLDAQQATGATLVIGASAPGNPTLLLGSPFVTGGT